VFHDQSNAIANLSSSERVCAQVRNAGDLITPELRALYRLWLEKSGNRPVPARSDFDVPELVPWLPHIMLSDYLDDGNDARFRVIGTWIVDQYGKDNSGKTASEIDLYGRTQLILSEYKRTAEAMAPHQICGPFFKHSGAEGLREAERLLLPLSKDGKTCDKFLTAVYFING
tara:strand:- start:462 stop:977 length:516 start_codon:yes stop_codon:yes gene_type:complete